MYMYLYVSPKDFENKYFLTHKKICFVIIYYYYFFSY